MSWFSDFLTDISGPIGKSAQAGMINQENRNRDLETMRKHIPIMVDQQRALLPGRLEEDKQRQDALLKNTLLRETLRNQMRQSAPPSPQTVARNELADYVSNPGTERVPDNYGAGEESTSGLAPTGSPFQSATPSSTGMRQQPRPYDPQKILGLGVRSGANVEPLMKRLFPEQAVTGSSRTTYDMDLGDKILVFDKATNKLVGEYPKVRSAGMGQGFENHAKMKFYQEGKELGLSDVDAAIYAQKRSLDVITGPTSATRSAATALASNTGAPQAAKVDTAYKTGEASARGGIQGQLAPVSPPSQHGQPLGPPVPGAQAVATVKELGSGIPAGEKKALSDLYTLQDMSVKIRELSGDFTKPYWGPAHNVAAITKERLGGTGGLPGLAPLGQEEIILRRHVNDMKDALLRARSGAAINEQEYFRLAKLLPSMDLPAETAKGRLAGFEEQLAVTIKNRENIQSGIQSTIGQERKGATPVGRPTIPKLAPEGLSVVRGAPKGKTFTIQGQTYTREQLLGEQ